MAKVEYIDDAGKTLQHLINLHNQGKVSELVIIYQASDIGGVVTTENLRNNPRTLGLLELAKLYLLDEWIPD